MQANELIQLRLASQKLTGAGLKTPLEVVRWLVAVQSQDYPGGLWGIGLRCGNQTDQAVEQALTEREIVRTWGLRGTLHTLPAEDARWIVDLAGERMIPRMQNMHLKRFDLDEAEIAKARMVLANALRGGNQMERNEIYRVLNRARIVTAGQRGVHILWRLGMEAFLCFGPRRAKPQTFVLFDEWLPDAPRRGREEALSELARRYFDACGPATEQDFAWWAGITLGEARKGLEANREHLDRGDYNGMNHWFNPAHAAAEPKPQAWLLPPYDAYTVSYKDRSVLFDPAVTTKRGEEPDLLMPVILINGMICGSWKRNLRNRRINLAFTPFSPFSEAEKALLARAAEDYGSHLTNIVQEGDEEQ